MKNVKNWTVNPSSILFILLFIVYCSTASVHVGGSMSLYKYIVLSLCILDSFFKWKKKKKILFLKEVKKIILSVVIILIYSLFKSLSTTHFTFRTIQEIYFIVGPLVYSFFVINTENKETILKNMKIAFCITFFFYLLSLDMSISSIINSLKSSSFAESHSDLESSLFCGLSLGFASFFLYYNKHKVFKYLSLLFVIMTFKRLFIVMAIVLLLISNSKIKDISVSKKVFILAFVLLASFSILYYFCLLPSNVYNLYYKYHIDLSQFTSTRSDRFKWLINSHYVSYGFGSSFEYMFNRIHGSLEMDIVKIFVELGFIPGICLIYSYLNASRYKVYSFIFCVFLILNLIFSSGLTGVVSWTLYLITIFYVQKNDSAKKGEAE